MRLYSINTVPVVNLLDAIVLNWTLGMRSDLISEFII